MTGFAVAKPGPDAAGARALRPRYGFTCPTNRPCYMRSWGDMRPRTTPAARLTSTALGNFSHGSAFRNRPTPDTRGLNRLVKLAHDVMSEKNNPLQRRPEHFRKPKVGWWGGAASLEI